MAGRADEIVLATKEKTALETEARDVLETEARGVLETEVAIAIIPETVSGIEVQGKISMRTIIGTRGGIATGWTQVFHHIMIAIEGVEREVACRIFLGGLGLLGL